MEDQVVDGQHVLVPVLYLAQADSRLAPNGALIQGSDVTLIAGQNLDNAGTLKATNNLAAMAGSDLVNSGLVQAGSRLDLLAGNDLTNQAGSNYLDEHITQLTGDVSAGRDLSVQAGRDITAVASQIAAKNDVSMAATEKPSAAEVAALIRQIRLERIKAVFVENIKDSRLLAQITEESGAQIGGTLYSDALAAKGPASTYLGMYRHNLETLSKALRD